MKKLILPLLALVTYASNGQFSLVPQVGLETYQTTITPGNLSSFSPLGQQFAPRLAVRAAYAFKSGHGIFAGLATGSPAVEFKFTDPDKANTVYTAASKNLQVRFEGGYQFSAKPISLKKAASTSPTNAKTDRVNNLASQSRCGRSMCSRGSGAASRYSDLVKTANVDNGLYLRIKPSVGVALAPSAAALTATTAGNQTSYMYKSGLNTAIITGVALEFGSRERARFVVGLNYLHSIGNSTKTVTNQDAFKPTTASVSSRTSGFNLSLGVPINFTKKTAAPVITSPKLYNSPARSGHCGRYRTYQL